MESSNITQIIIDTINTLFQNLVGSITNQLYSVLDDITFISSDILTDRNFEAIFGSSTTNGILVIANSLLLGLILYFSLRYFLSHFTYTSIEKPQSFLIKLILCGICMNFSYFLLDFFLSLTSDITFAIRNLGETLFHKNICFSELITMMHSSVGIQENTLNLFSLDGLLQTTLSFSLLNLVFSYSLRYIMIKIFVLISPFAILSASLSSTSWFFKAWIRNLFSLLFIQIIVSLVLVILFSMNYSSSDLFSKIVYIGGIYALIKANSFVREFIGGISTTVSQSVNSFTGIKK